MGTQERVMTKLGKILEEEGLRTGSGKSTRGGRTPVGGTFQEVVAAATFNISGSKGLDLLLALDRGLLKQYLQDVMNELKGDYSEIDLGGTSVVPGSGPTAHAMFNRGALVFGLRLNGRANMAEAFWRTEVDGRYVKDSVPLMTLDKLMLLDTRQVANALRQEMP
jgi:hypothetical protein